MNSIRRHMTASVYIFSGSLFESSQSGDKTACIEKVLLIFHPKMQKWLPPGGHLEENELPHRAAQREVLEETGLEIEWRLRENITINEWNAKSIPRPYLCLLESVEDKKGPHEHIDFIFIANALKASKAFTDSKSSEAKVYNSGIESGLLKWFSLEEALALEGDRDIFIETQKVLKHLMNQQACAL